MIQGYDLGFILPTKVADRHHGFFALDDLDFAAIPRTRFEHTMSDEGLDVTAKLRAAWVQMSAFDAFLVIIFKCFGKEIVISFSKWILDTLFPLVWPGCHKILQYVLDMKIIVNSRERNLPWMFGILSLADMRCHIFRCEFLFLE